jgi:hypothetical protein
MEKGSICPHPPKAQMEKKTSSVRIAISFVQLATVEDVHGAHICFKTYNRISVHIRTVKRLDSSFAVAGNGTNMKPVTEKPGGAPSIP